MNRSLVATALASFIALGTQGAFADTGTPDNSNTAVAPAAVPISSQATQAVTSMAPAMKPGRARHAARIPGTFALAGTDSSHDRDAQNQADSIRLMLPPLSGDGGG